MSIRVRETRGTSWRGAEPGTRHYRSTSVSYGGGTYLAGLGAWAFLVLPFMLMWWCLLIELWLCAEVLLLAVTGVPVIAAVTRERGRARDITLTRARWHLYAFGLKGVRQ